MSHVTRLSGKPNFLPGFKTWKVVCCTTDACVKQQYSCGANGGKADDEMREGGFCPSLCLLIPEDMVIKSSGFNWDSLFLPDLFPHADKKNKP